MDAVGLELMDCLTYGTYGFQITLRSPHRNIGQGDIRRVEVMGIVFRRVRTNRMENQHFEPLWVQVAGDIPDYGIDTGRKAFHDIHETDFLF
ncbi:MAG: hypothetical protein A2041_10695 [Bacteroidetes bacterium GWA2_31_9b]|nr:MAG: hypothetical protein A2041_10695 [Bacteroidetes bacterium GWA2_31_9b]